MDEDILPSQKMLRSLQCLLQPFFVLIIGPVLQCLEV